jgi:membrane protease YdiL (CAAX protease family)
LAVVGWTWAALMLTPALVEPWVPRAIATEAPLVLLAAFALTRAPRFGRETGSVPMRGATYVMGGLAALVSYPAWIALIASTGAALGLEGAAPIGPRAPGWFGLARLVVLVPIVEETVYRQILQGALTRRCGSLVAIPIASAIFAASHLEPWPMLASLGLGLVAGVLARASGDIALGVGLHAGLNLAGSHLGVPAFGRVIDPVHGVPMAAGLLCVGVALLRARASADSCRRSSTNSDAIGAPTSNPGGF